MKLERYEKEFNKSGLVVTSKHIKFINRIKGLITLSIILLFIFLIYSVRHNNTLHLSIQYLLILLGLMTTTKVTLKPIYSFIKRWIDSTTDNKTVLIGMNGKKFIQLGDKFIYRNKITNNIYNIMSELGYFENSNYNKDYLIFSYLYYFNMSDYDETIKNLSKDSPNFRSKCKVLFGPSSMLYKNFNKLYEEYENVQLNPEQLENILLKRTINIEDENNTFLGKKKLYSEVNKGDKDYKLCFIWFKYTMDIILISLLLVYSVFYSKDNIFNIITEATITVLMVVVFIISVFALFFDLTEGKDCKNIHKYILEGYNYFTISMVLFDSIIMILMGKHIGESFKEIEDHKNIKIKTNDEKFYINVNHGRIIDILNYISIINYEKYSVWKYREIKLNSESLKLAIGLYARTEFDNGEMLRLAMDYRDEGSKLHDKLVSREFIDKLKEDILSQSDSEKQMSELEELKIKTSVNSFIMNQNNTRK